MRTADSILRQIPGTFYTYLHRRNDTGAVFYIGKGLARRALQKCGRNDRWSKIVAKHGFTAEILAPWPTEQEAFAHEVFLISTFRGMGFELANYSNGGEGASGNKQSAETIAKRAASLAIAFSDPAVLENRLKAMRAGKSTAAHRDLTSERMKRERGTPKARAKQSQDSKAAWSNPEERARRVDLMRAAAARPEVRARLTEISRQRVKDPAQVAAAAAHLRAMNASKAKPVICLTTGQEFASCTEAASVLGINKQGVKDVCLGRYTHTRGLKFAFKHQDAEAPSIAN